MKSGVITGDIVDSSKISPKVREALYKGLEAYFKILENKKKGFKAETNQGDWFQAYCKDVSQILRYALLIKTWLKSFPVEDGNLKFKKEMPKSVDARMTLGIGEVDFLSSRLGNSDGAAFRLSGRLLEKIKKTSRTLAVEVEDKKEINQELEVMFQMLDFIIGKTTSLQCQVIHRKLQGMKETEIAAELKILQSAVNQRSTAAGWNVIETALNRFEFVIASQV